ncbi:MAG: trypsin-like peptidase domain-containing protein [Ignavibacteriales bacterium]|nr:trypsin-like peptidase domain-containing protein [Ignavibacteriales bacterium]
MRRTNSFLPKLVLIILSAALFSCTSTYETIYPTLNDGKYDSEFPYKNSSTQLEEISTTIKLINTATIIYESQGMIALLTVAHVVSFPDTIISYFVDKDGSFTDNVQSISIKTHQSNYVPDLPGDGKLDILLIDKTLDIALLGRKFSPTETIGIPVFRYPWGKSTDLEWGSFVYVFGFPMNNKMISKGIVSNPQKDRHSFLIDAVFNRGYSGGIVLAIRDGVPNFELVGLVKSVPADYQYSLHPLTKKGDFDFNPMLPYKGEVYVEREQIIRTGITRVIGIEAVTDFLRDNKDYLTGKGYYFTNIFEDDSVN